MTLARQYIFAYTGLMSSRAPTGRDGKLPLSPFAISRRLSLPDPAPVPTHVVLEATLREHGPTRYDIVNPGCVRLHTTVYSSWMRETILIATSILIAFLFSGLAGLIIGATLSPTAVFIGASILASITVALIILALWKQQ